MRVQFVGTMRAALVAASVGLFTFASPGEAAATGCTCTGTGIDGPFTIQCNETVCGTDSQTYMCTAQDTYSGPRCGVQRQLYRHVQRHRSQRAIQQPGVRRDRVRDRRQDVHVHGQ